LPVEDIVSVLQDITKAETIDADSDALMLIARQATGSMRDAISLLDQLSSNGTKIDLTLAQTVLGTAANQSVTELTDALIDNNITAGLEIINKALDKGSDPRQFARQVVDYLRSILLIQYKNDKSIDATKDQMKLMKHQAEKMAQTKLVQAIKVFNEAAVDNRASWQPGLSLELALAQLMLGPALVTMSVETHTSGDVSKKASAELPPSRAGVLESPVLKQAAETTKSVAQETSDSAPVISKPNVTDQTTIPSKQQSQPHEGEVNLHTISSSWEEIKLFVRKYRKPTEALLNSCKPILIKDNSLYLSFASDTVKTLMDKKENLELTARAVYAITGAEVSVRCIVNKSKTESSDGILDIDEDGMVNTALNLGGKIVQKD